MRYIYLSPHLDDAVFSCGGIIREQIHQGNQVEVWTYFTADPPDGPLFPFAQSLHTRWKETQNPSLIRRQEDEKAAKLLGYHWKHLDFPDCIYRFRNDSDEPLIKTSDDLFSPEIEVDMHLVHDMSKTLEGLLWNDAHHDRLMGIPNEQIKFIAPLAIGNHIDHRSTRKAAENFKGQSLLYYADFPYAAKETDQIIKSLPQDVTPLEYKLSADALATWQNAIACYASQISSFWPSLDEMKAAVADYASQPLARTLWIKTSPT